MCYIYIILYKKSTCFFFWLSRTTYKSSPVFNATRVSRKSSAKVGKVTYMWVIRFSQQRFYIFYLGLLTTDVAQSYQKQKAFLKPHLVIVTDTRPTSRKFVVISFPGPSAPDPDALTTRQQHPLQKHYESSYYRHKPHIPRHSNLLFYC